MRRLGQRVRDIFLKGDMILLLLCVVTNVFGCLVIASATNNINSYRYVIIQIVAMLLGIVMYTVVSMVDADFMSEHRTALFLFNTVLLLLLMAGDCQENQNTALLTLVLYLFL